jgi:hypothetical protein
MEALRRLLDASKLIDFTDCKDERVWQALGAAQGTAEGVLRDGVASLEQRRAMFKAYSECLTSTDMLPNEIADKLIVAAHPAIAAPTELERDGMIAAAVLIEKKADNYLNDFAEHEPDTGDIVFRNGAQGRDYHSTLTELAEEIRIAAIATGEKQS